MGRKFLKINSNMLLKNREKLYKLAYIDPVTNLGNYNYYLKAINQQKDKNKTIIIIDIDKFKTFNKIYGHNKGDELLKKVGKEIQLCIRNTDVVCRLANDVYGILICNITEADMIAKRLNEKISKIEINNIKYPIKITIGIYINKKEESAQSMIDKAIIAHDKIKGKYNEVYCEFTEEFAENLIKETKIENMMIEGIEKEEFEIYYQPQIDVKTQEVKCIEALVRWISHGNIISPKEFIPIFEKNFFIINLDKYVYEKVCKDINKLKKEIKHIPMVSINVSKESLMEKGFLEKCIEISKKYNVKPEEIQFEITERTTIEKNIRSILEKIKNEGYSIAIDDFGTGYSSLNVLEFMPIDTIKIDKSFIDKIEENKKGKKILDIIIMIAQKLKLKTVAEGVEKNEQKNYLEKIGCDLIQGYYYSKPLKFEDIKEFLLNTKFDKNL